MKNYLTIYLKITNKWKTIGSLATMFLGSLITITGFYISLDTWMNPWFIIVVSLIVFGVINISHHAIYFCGVDLPFPLTKNTVNKKWEHCFGHEYPGVVAILLSVIITYLISHEFIGQVIIMIGFMLGFRRGWNYNAMEEKIRNCGEEQVGIIKRWLTFGNVGILLTAIMAFAILVQSIHIGNQTNIIKRRFELENRPYLYMDLVPLTSLQREKDQKTGKENDNLYVGARLIYKNIGKLPACNIQSEIHFYSDKDPGDNFERLKKWYIKEYSYFPKPTTIFPNQGGQEIIGTANCAKSTKDYLFTIRLKYTGANPDKLYWYSIDVRYSIEKEQFIQTRTGKNYGVRLTSVESHYDRNVEAKMPLPLPQPEKWDKTEQIHPTKP